jgi:two-component system sensor histidine kinase ChvG
MKVRGAIYGGALLLVGLPLVLLFSAAVYERLLVSRVRGELERAASAVARGAPLDEIARRERISVRLIGAGSELVADSHTSELAMSHSLLGGAAERVLPFIQGPDDDEPLDAIEPTLGAFGERVEVRSARTGQAAFAQHSAPRGSAVVFALAVPDGAGHVAYFEKGSRRGVRRLLNSRAQLLQLTLYDLTIALVLAALLGARIARPLERLDARIRGEALTDGDPLLGRRDEIGQVARTIAKLTRALEARRLATAELGADVAHELKGPLATIAASAELLTSRGAPSAEKAALVAATLGEAVARMGGSIDALSNLLRLEERMATEPRALCDYRALLDELAGEYRRDPRWRAVDFRITVAEDARHVLLIRARWLELLRNLVDNALAQGTAAVEISVDCTSADIVTRVRDFGPGVPLEAREQIFRRFYTHRPAGSPPGTGLGLSIVVAIAAAHGASVRLVATDGPGATFATTLPRAVLEASSPPP